MDPYEERWNELQRSKMFDKLRTIKRGEFKEKSDPFHKIQPKREIQNQPSDIDFILTKRQELERLKGKAGEDEYEGTAPSEYAELTAAEKIREVIMRDWVNQCYESIRNPQHSAAKDVKMLVDWDKKRTALNSAVGNIGGKKVGSPAFEGLDRDVSSDGEKLSSEGSEGDLRRKVTGEDEPHQRGSDKMKTTKTFAPEKKSKVVDKLREGITVKLEEFYVHDLKELESLAYDEELYIFNPEGDIVGSWRVNVKICEDNDNLVNVQFEGLLARENHGTINCMYSSGLVDRFYCPLTEFRVELTSGSDKQFSKTMFFHEKQRAWHFDVRQAERRGETSNTFKLNYDQMLHVVTESAHILLMRKIVMYRCPLDFDQEHHTTECSKLSHTCTCPAGFPTRKRFVLKMRTLCIEGQICRANYRFYAPVRVKFHRQDLNVVRVRRRVEMPGQLVQTSNYYITTAGQLVAITFNDPYPYDTPYYLQVDPKAVLDPSRVIPPERIVPLRERYMHDPELRRYFNEEVKKLEDLNKSYIDDHEHLYSYAKTLLMELMADKPHRVSDYIQGPFMCITPTGECS